MVRLQGKTAIITGAASGIGAGTAELFAEEGARLILVDQNEAALESVASKLPSPSPGEPLRCAGDIAATATVERAISLALEATGKIDIVVNNAGIMESRPLAEVDEAAWDRLLDVNLRSMYVMTRRALPHMLAAGRGAIVNTSSVMAFLTEPHYEAYTTSKAGIIGFTKAVAVSYAAQGIRSNCICPGWVDTPMNRALADELGVDALNRVVSQQQPLGRMVSTREVAQAILFLASDEASGVTGVALNVDGGAGSAI
ncbi:MAG TPA: glucose 1-dehydrogenase [Thermomicrobiales bacterium]|nr:glucose 1-dehydrogenase [Thermomicrobiales bacterium]